MRARSRISVWVGTLGRLLNSGAGEVVGATVASPAHWINASRFERAPRAGRHQGMLPWYQTPDEFAAAVAACESALAIPDIEVVSDVVEQAPTGRAPALAPDDAARLFVEHLRSLGGGQFGNDALNRLYTEHCAALGVDELHQSVLREAMKYVQGVVKRQTDRRSASGKRRREFVWDVSAGMAQMPLAA
mgnify:CR=1 FL=1